MPEYGIAVETRGPAELQPDELLSVHRLLDRNYRLTAAKRPEWNLPEHWQFQVGPMTQAHESLPCPDCNGTGAVSAIAGHCFDIDGGLWHAPGECTAPEHLHRPCCPPCETCDGTSFVHGPPIPGVYDHVFAWYVNTEETIVNMNAVQALAKHHTRVEHTDPTEDADEDGNRPLCTCWADAEVQIQALHDAGYDVVPRTVADTEDAPQQD